MITDRQREIYDACVRACMCIVILLAIGCASRTEKQTDTERRETETYQGTVAFPVTNADGQVTLTNLPVNLTVTKRATEVAREQSETKSGIDQEALVGAVTLAVRSAVAAAMPGATMSAGGGMGVTGWMSAIGGLATVATTGYLAMAKRDQVRQTKRPNSNP